MSGSKNLNEKIAKVAYELYEKRGRIHGYALADWAEAERIVMNRHAQEIEDETVIVKAARIKRTASEAEAKTVKTGTRKTTQRKAEKTAEKTQETKSRTSTRKKTE
ncbi:MAG: DUF2934 domain-containing protein [Thermodesulfovibrionales bacterium]|jgi:hypothetical protein